MKEIGVHDLNYDGVVEFTRHLYEHGYYHGKKICFDLNRLNFIEPGGSILFFVLIDNLKRQNIPFSYKLDMDFSKDAISYGYNTGVFNILGIFNNSYNKHGSTYISPEKVVIKDLITQLEKDKTSFEQYYEIVSKYIVTNSVKNLNLSRIKDIQDLFIYVVREIVRNIFDHSKTDHFYYASQIYPSHNEVEVVIADVGLGLVNTIPFDIEEKWHGFNTDEEAIRRAITPGITAESNHPYAPEPYKNSGYGLAMVKEILNQSNGIFCIASGEKTIKFINGREFVEPCDIGGTVIRMKVRLDNLVDVDVKAVLSKLEKEALEKGFKQKPSSASKTIKSKEIF